MPLSPAPDSSPLCKSSFDFAGTDPTLWCDLPRGHDGPWHIERGVGRWTFDDETFQWFDSEGMVFEGDSLSLALVTGSSAMAR